MKHILLASDSFKGTLSAREVCEIEMQAIRDICPDALVTVLPLSDGGEGLAETCLMIFGGELVQKQVTGPNGAPVTAEYAMLQGGFAGMEMACAAGLPLMHGRLDPMHATTRGVGELLLDAKSRGAKKILLGLGGSATNDCGIGMAYALGYHFFGQDGAELAPIAENLGKIMHIEKPKEQFGIPVEVACDVDNPLLGKHGATYTFGPQKGAGKEQMELLESGLRHFAGTAQNCIPEFNPNAPGAGAAGGMGAMVRAVLHGELHRGIDLVLDAAGFDKMLEGTDLVITGEGRLDTQTKRGKVPSGVLQRTQKAGVPCVAVCGAILDEKRCMEELGFDGIYASTHEKKSMEELQKTCRKDLYHATKKAITEMIEKGPSRK